MKVRITMEADVTDLPSFNQSDSGRENLIELLNRDLRCHAIVRLMEQMIQQKETDPVIHKALLASLEQDKQLTKRLVDSVDIQYGPRDPEREA